MVENKTIQASTLVTLGLILLAGLAPDFFDTPKYYCEIEKSILECPGGLSGGSGTRCYLDEAKSTWDYCSSGWLKIEPDTQITETNTVKQINVGDEYRCYPGKDYCRKGGLFTNPKVTIEDIAK